jgi:hypothetical protein
MIDLTHLERLEAESIYIFREVVAEAENPVMLYSVGKDSSVMLHLARKAFYPAPPPFPVLHVASGWDFKDLLVHRDRTVREYGLKLIIAANEEAEAQGINPFDTGSALYSQAQLTDPLKRALSENGFDAAFGGGRRDEEGPRSGFSASATLLIAGIRRTSDPSCGTSTMRRRARARAFASFRSRTGPNSISGSILRWKRSTSYHSISPSPARLSSGTACCWWWMMNVSGLSRARSR